MKNLISILILILLPLQYTWALAASYDLHAEDYHAHFGHHDHQVNSHHDNFEANADKDADNTQTPKPHDHYGFSHMSCVELLSHDLPNLACETNQYLIQYTFHYHAPPNNTLERPNWIAAV